MDAKLKKIRKNLDFYKKEHDGAIIIFRANDGYMMFCEDVERASDILRVYLDDRIDYYQIWFPYDKLDEYLPKLIRKGYKVVIADMIDIEDNGTTLQVYEDSIETHGFDCNIKENNDKSKNNTMENKNNIKVMGIEVIKALKGELPATLADYLYDAIGKLEVIKIKHKLNLTPNRSEIAYLIEQAEINRGE